MARIQFKGKIETVYNMDDTIAYRLIRVPTFARAHCDMNAFRRHPKYGSYANSDLFPAFLSRIRKDTFPRVDYFRLDQTPEGVTVDTSGFLAVVTLDA